MKPALVGLMPGVRPHEGTANVDVDHGVIVDGGFNGGYHACSWGPGPAGWPSRPVLMIQRRAGASAIQ